MSLDISYRTCSRCLTHVPSDLTECACGHSFDLDKPEPVRSPAPSKPRRARTVEVKRTVEVIHTESEEQRQEAHLEKDLKQALDTLRRVRTGGDGKWGDEQIENVRLALKAVEVARKNLAAYRDQTSGLNVATRPTRKVQTQHQAQKPETPKPEKITAQEKHMPAAPDFAPAMPEKLRVAQSVKAEQIHKPAPPMQDCPHCSASVAADVTRCGCGYEFSGTVLMPAIVLPAEEKTAVKSAGRKSTG